MNKLNIIITGCLGFIGYEVYRRFSCSEVQKIICIDKCTYAADQSRIPIIGKNNPRTTFFKMDINDITTEFLEEHEIGCIINLAAESHVERSIGDVGPFIHSNVNGVVSILEAITGCENPPFLMHFSTDEVYGDIELGSHDENAPMKPSNPYAASKASADLLIQSWARTHGIKYLIVRPTNNYGPTQHEEKLIPAIAKLISEDKKIPLHDGGDPVRNWCHVQDTADATFYLYRLWKDGYHVDNNAYNISANYELPNWVVVWKALRIMNKIRAPYPSKEDIQDFVDYSYNRPGQDIRYSLDTTKINNLGWRARRIFNEELPNILARYNSQRYWTKL
jgi:dTDP-glucose 4,6-dehydratase